jgi:plastocyanin
MRPVTLSTLAGLIALAVSALGLVGSASADDVTIDTGDPYFCSAAFENGVCESTIAVGDTVTWDVSEGFHTVNQCDTSFESCEVGFQSGELEPGDTYAHTFDGAGTYPYRCEFHPDEMRGRIIVIQPTPTPTPAPTSPGQTAAPTVAGVPKTGGQPPDGPPDGLGLTLLLAGGLVLIVASGAAFVAARSSSRSS